MQLLKLASSYNSVSSPNFDKSAHSKNYLLDILQKCRHIPKDDRLVLRGYLSNLKNFDENDPILNLLLKCSHKQQKQNKDQKIQILLRKQADKIKKQNLSKISQTKKIQSSTNKQNYKQIVTNKQKYCNNFEILRNNFRIPSFQKSYKSYKSLMKQQTLKHQYNSSKQKQNSIQRKKNKEKLQFNYSKIKQSLKSLEANQLPHKKLTPNTSHKFIKTKKNQYEKFKNKNQNAKKSNAKQQKQIFEQKQARVSNFIPFQMTKPTHRYTKSKSLGSLAVDYEEDKQFVQTLKDVNSQELEKEQTLYSYRNQSVNLKTSSMNACENLCSAKDMQNICLQNFNTISLVKNTNFEFCKQYMTAGSIHASLKNLKIKAESLFQYLIPLDIRLSRSPSDLSMPYSQFIRKMNDYILQNCNILNNQFCCPSSVYIPFHTKYDLVTFEKLTQFIDEYAIPVYQNNEIRDLYTRIQIGMSSSGKVIFNQKRICCEEFKNVFKWKKSKVIPLFQKVIKRCSQWGTCITYWELFWLKNSSEFKQFQKQYNID